MSSEKPDGWIGVDLDGTLAKRLTTYHAYSIGEPIAPMVARVCAWIDAGRDVRIFTARVSHDDPMVDKAIRAWCLRHVGCELPVTNVKDYLMAELWDDRAVSVEVDTGRDMRASELRAAVNAYLAVHCHPGCSHEGCDDRYLEAQSRLTTLEMLL